MGLCVYAQTLCVNVSYLYSRHSFLFPIRTNFLGAIVTANLLIVLVICDVYKASPIESASICLLLGGSLCGALILTRHWSRQGLIIATSICGSILIVGGVDYLIEEWRLMGKKNFIFI